MNIHGVGANLYSRRTNGTHARRHTLPAFRLPSGARALLRRNHGTGNYLRADIHTVNGDEQEVSLPGATR